MLRKRSIVLLCIGYGQVSLSDSVRVYEMGPIVVEERYRVTPVYRLDPARSPLVSSLQGTFEQVPGVFWMGTSAHGGRPVLRGLSYQRILLLYNHLPREGDYWGEDHGYEVPARSFFLLPEVLLGPQGVRYGSGALGGVISYRPIIADSTSFLWQMQALSNPPGAFTQVGYQRRLSDFCIATEGGFQRLSNYIEPLRGPVWNTGLQEAYSGLVTERSWNTYVLRAWAYYFSQKLGLPPEGWDPETREWTLDNGTTIPARAAQSFRIDYPYQRIQNLTTGTELSRAGQEAITTFRLSYMHNQRAEYGYDSEAPDVWLRNHRIGTEWVRTHARYQVGVSGLLAHRRDAGVEPFAPAALSWESGLWARYRYLIRRSQWQFGLRLHYGGHHHLDTLITRHFFTWAAEITYETPTYWLKLARSFRIPHPVELWANGFHEGARRYEIGTPTLPTETAYSIESRLGYQAFTFQTYLMYFPQYIFFERIADSLPSAIGAAFRYSAKPALLTGWEATYQKEWLSIDLGYVYGLFLRETADSLRAMPKIPPFRVRLLVQRPRGVFQPYVEVSLYAPQQRAFTAYRTEIPTPCYGVVQGGLRIPRRRRRFTLGGTNLLNARYQSHLNIFRQWGEMGIYAPGRGFYWRVEFQ